MLDSLDYLPKTDIVKIYQSKGNSDTLAVVIPKHVRSNLNLQRGDKLKATFDTKTGNIVYQRMTTSRRIKV